MNKLYLDLNRSIDASVFLAGTGRSGTTWVEEIINAKNEYRVMFEPFHSKKIDLCRGYNYRQYLRFENSDPYFLKSAKAILSGKVRHKWIDQCNKRSIFSKRLIKDIRANLMLRWFYAHFPQMPIVLLLRHPCAVALSKVKLKWGDPLEEILEQEELMNDYLNPFKKDIESVKTKFERHIFVWCIENYIPLKQFQAGEIYLVFYENLCRDSAVEVRRLFEFLGKKYDEDILANLNVPSALSRKDSAIKQKRDVVNAWRSDVSNDEIQKSIEILSLFGLNKIYGQESMPKVDSKSAFTSYPDLD